MSQLWTRVVDSNDEVGAADESSLLHCAPFVTDDP